MGSLAYLFGVLGAVLILVAVVGGGFTFMGATVPKVGRVARCVGFVLGTVVLVASIGVLSLEGAVTTQGTGRPSTETTTAPTGTTPPTVIAPTTSPPPPVATVPTTPSTEYAVGYVGAGGYTTAHVFQEPSTTSPILFTLPQGTVVYILCTERGETVSDTTATYSSDLWNYTSHGGYVADVVLDTGTTEPTMPPC